MVYKIQIKIPNGPDVFIELDESNSPKTVQEFVKNLPFSAELNVWGEEIYSSESPIDIAEENAQSIVSLNDVAYWPQGKAICLFYGYTPIGNKGEIIPASPVNVIGRIIDPDKKILSKVEGKTAKFKLAS